MPNITFLLHFFKNGAQNQFPPPPIMKGKIFADRPSGVFTVTPYEGICSIPNIEFSLQFMKNAAQNRFPP